MGPGASTLNTSTLCRIFPAAGSTQTARSDLPPSVAVVSQRCLSAITGEDQPRPSIGSFHLMFSEESVHFTGAAVTFDSPWPSGPRNCGQSWADAASEQTSTIASALI